MPYNANFTWIEKEQLKKAHNSYVMVARPRKYNFAVPVESTGTVRLFFEPLIDEPETILNSDNPDFVKAYYIAFDSNQDSEFLPDYYEKDGYDMEERAFECEEFYAGKLAVFMPFYKISSEGPSYKNMQIIDIVDDHNGAYYLPVPRIEMDNKRFEKQLKSQEYFVIDGYDNRLIGGTDIVICGDYAYRFKNRQLYESFLTGSELRNEAWKCNCSDERDIVKVKYTDFDGYEDYIIDGTRTTYLVEDSLIQLIMDADNCISIDEQENKEPISSAEEMLEDNDLNDIMPADDEIEEIPETEEAKAYNASEITFIKGLLALTKENSLVYEYKDLVNFHTSVKTNNLTILSGMSGTGKTQLAYNYARMLDLSEDNNTLLFMPISPSYSEPSDILGYLNPMTGEYVPSETGLVDFLIHANKNKNKMHMVIFDEMNLSQVEYWFSPFISILEKDMDDRFLKLYDDNPLEDKDKQNNKKYPSKIRIDENVIFVGTVNIDETTKSFSDRLLDRTFVINLKKIGFRDVYESLNSNDDIKIDISSAKCGDASIFMAWNKKYSKKYLEAFENHQDELDFLDAFSELLSTTIHSDGISHRVLRNIGYFLLNVPEDENGSVINRDEAFDIIVNQTVMQKIRGTEAQLSPLIGIGKDETNSTENSSLMDLLNKYRSISKFENVKRTINKKAEDLRINGYTN